MTDTIRATGGQGIWRYIEIAQTDGWNLTTAYGAYRKAGGTMSARRFRSLWRLAKVNPFRWNHGI